METETVKSIDVICGVLIRRMRAPGRSVTFYAHLFLAVLLGGGAGIWFTLLKSGFDVDKLAAALLTYFPALVAAALIDLTQERQPYLRSFGLISAGGFLTIFVIGATRVHGAQCAWAFLGALLSVLFWWIANGDKTWVRDVAPDAATGGDVTKDLLKSEDEGWKV
jgi:hypothetical protein